MADNTRYDFDTLISRENTNAVKWDFMPMEDESTKGELLPLWIADMDFPCARPILDAMRERLDRDIFGYSSPYADDYLNAVTGWFKRHYGWDIENESVAVAPGIVPAVGILVRALTQAGDGVIIQRPVYYPFTRMIENNGRNVVNNPLVNTDGFYTMDFEDLEAKARDPKNSMMILCNPHNPVGRVWTPDELKTVAEICLKHNVLLISDDIHCDLVRGNVRYTPVSKLVDDERIITCTAASKTFNLAGLQISNIIINDKDLREKWDQESRFRCGLHGSNPLSIAATTAAYNEGEPWLEQVNAYMTANLEYVGEFVREHFPGAKYWFPEGTYFAWIDFTAYGHSNERLEELMLKKAKVALDEGYIFGEEGSGFERINVACPRSVLEDCMTRMTKALG